MQLLLEKIAKNHDFGDFWWVSCFWHDVTYDVAVASYKVCLYLFWYQWTREGHSYPLVPHDVSSIGCWDLRGGGGIRKARPFFNIANRRYVQPLGLWTENEHHFWLIWLNMKSVRRQKVGKNIQKQCRNTSFLPLPLRIWRFALPYWLLNFGGGVINGKTDVISAWNSWSWCILWCEINLSCESFQV